eukprot:XP_027307194.1 uncharacterized protein LOC113842727 isoform X2 [Anas platyrhynchos]
MEKGSSETHRIFLTSRATQDGSPKGAEHRSFTTCPISARPPALPRQLQGWNKATEKATSSSQCLCTESAPRHPAIPLPAATGQCPKPWAKGASHKQDPQPVNVFSGSCKSTWHNKGLRGRGKEGRPTTQHLALGSLMATATAQLLPAKGSRKKHRRLKIPPCGSWLEGSKGFPPHILSLTSPLFPGSWKVPTAQDTALHATQALGTRKDCRVMETRSSTTTRLSPTSRALPVSSTFHTVMGNGSALHHAAPLTVCTGTYNFPRAAHTQSTAPHTLRSKLSCPPTPWRRAKRHGERELRNTPHLSNLSCHSRWKSQRRRAQELHHMPHLCSPSCLATAATGLEQGHRKSYFKVPLPVHRERSTPPSHSATSANRTMPKALGKGSLAQARSTTCQRLLRELQIHMAQQGTPRAWKRGAANHPASCTRVSHGHRNGATATGKGISEKHRRLKILPVWKLAGRFQRLPTTHSLSNLSFIPWQLEGPHGSGHGAPCHPSTRHKKGLQSHGDQQLHYNQAISNLPCSSCQLHLPHRHGQRVSSAPRGTSHGLHRDLQLPQSCAHPELGTTHLRSKLSCPPTPLRRVKRNGERELRNTPHLSNLSCHSRWKSQRRRAQELHHMPHLCSPSCLATAATGLEQGHRKSNFKFSMPVHRERSTPPSHSATSGNRTMPKALGKGSLAQARSTTCQRLLRELQIHMAQQGTPRAWKTGAANHPASCTRVSHGHRNGATATCKGISEKKNRRLKILPVWKLAGRFQRLPTTHSLSNLSFIPWQLEGPHGSGHGAPCHPSTRHKKGLQSHGDQQLHCNQAISNLPCSSCQLHLPHRHGQRVSSAPRGTSHGLHRDLQLPPSCGHPEFGTTYLRLKLSCPPTPWRRAKRHGERELRNTPHLSNLSCHSRWKSQRRRAQELHHMPHLCSPSCLATAATGLEQGHRKSYFKVPLPVHRERSTPPSHSATSANRTMPKALGKGSLAQARSTTCQRLLRELQIHMAQQGTPRAWKTVAANHPASCTRVSHAGRSPRLRTRRSMPPKHSAQERIAESWRPEAPLQPGYLQPPVLFLSAPPSTPSWATGQLCTTRHLSRSAQGPTTSPELRTPRARHHTPALEALMPSNTIATFQEKWRKGAQKHTSF